MRFHEKLYELRKNAGMTQNDLAEKLNVSRQAVSRWEMGTAMPDVENLIAISDLFEKTLDELLREGDLPERRSKERPEGNRFWDHVPSKWWLPLVLTLAAMMCNYLWIFLYTLFPPSAGVASDASGVRLLWPVVFWIFGPVGFNIMIRILPWISAACLIVGFVRWQKEKDRLKTSPSR